MIAKDIMSSDFIKIDKEETLSKLLGKFEIFKKAGALVFDKKKYIGIVSKRKMLKSRLQVDEEKVKRIIAKPAVLNGGEDIAKVASLMNSSDVHMLPILGKGIVNGVVYALDVIKQLDQEAKEKRVSDVSRARVVAFDQNTEIGKVINTMHLRKIDRVPLVDKKNKLAGIVSIVDLLLKYAIFTYKRPGGKNIREARSSPGKERGLMSLPISNEATADVVTAKMNERIKKVISLMEKNNISDVVIIDDYNEPVGIVTVKDLLKLF